ncbi:hypothetical protein YQE_08954, partial [Dendroctonus ponderosae]
MSELQQRRKAPIVQGQSQFFQAIGCKVVGGSNCPPKFSSRWFKEKLAPVEKVPNVSFSFGDLNQQRADPTSPNAGYNLYKEEGPIETPHDASLFQSQIQNEMREEQTVKNSRKRLFKSKRLDSSINTANNLIEIDKENKKTTDT